VILDIDLGNTHLKWRCLKEGALVLGRGAQPVAADSLPELSGLLELLDTSANSLRRIRMASVASLPLTRRIGEKLRQITSVEPEFAHSSRQCAGVRNGYRDPAQLGVDRWLALLAAWHHHQGCCAVLDCGTAVTLDLLDGQGQHLGGYILPGVHLMKQAVLAGTGRLAHQAELAWEPGTGPGRDTGQALDHALLVALQSLVQEGLSHPSLDSKLPLLVTGGGGKALLPWLNTEAEHHPELVLEGLALALP